MEWLKSLLGLGEKPKLDLGLHDAPRAGSAGEARKPVAEVRTPGPQDSSAADWYCVDSPDRSVHQVVMSFPPESLAETSFGLIMLPADKYPILAMNSWCAGLCTINGQSVAMFRAGEFASAVKVAGVTVAVSFCHMPSHPILMLSVRTESAQLTAAVRRKYAHVPALTHPIAEWITGMSPYDRDLISSVFGSDRFRLVLAQDSSSRNSVFLPDGRRQDSAMPGAICEFHKDLGHDLKGALQDRWRALLAYDATIPRARRNFPRANGEELVRVLPTDKDPILPRRR